MSHRDTIGDPWGPPTDLGPEINSAAMEVCSLVTIDGHWLYFLSGRSNRCGGLDLWFSGGKDKRDDRGWEKPKNLGCIVNCAYTEHGPSRMWPIPLLRLA